MSEKTPRILCPTATLTHTNTKRSYVNAAYSYAIEYVGGVLVPIASRRSMYWDELLDTTADAILLQGGCDIHPSMYNEIPIVNTDACDVERDTIEKYVLERAIERNIPVLAICRGMQLLNVVKGGALYQDLPPKHSPVHNHSSNPNRAFLSHSVHIENGNTLYKALGRCPLLPVNSLHHQGISKLGEGLKVLGTSPDGLVEAIELVDHPFCLGVQWHPEELIVDLREFSLFRTFVEMAKQ